MADLSNKPKAPSTVSCVDLKEEFGDRYRITKDESYWAEHGKNAWTHDPWYLIMPCRVGHIFPHGGTTLGISLDGHPVIAKRLARMKRCRVHQPGADGTTLLFDLADFQQVAEIVRPHRRPRLSETQRADQRKRMLAMRALGQTP